MAKATAFAIRPPVNDHGTRRSSAANEIHTAVAPPTLTTAFWR